ncbi:ribonuclease P protein component [Caldalkalibacillus mannanilyticus]|uniref:ribonuclease P protein component n=1 Tax=Caldalkalibacillus mannanilyticus TaxID=1418 RepID=UPI00046883D4|nr:ribonuclease P protein component [Caldalkalibacillus mannanilyticus]
MEKSHRLQKNEHFQHVFKRGSSIANRQLVLYYMPNPDTPEFRLGISVSKKIGHAVIRNKIKRLLKEAVRAEKDRIPKGYDFILIVRKPAADLGLEELQSSVIHLLKKARLYKKVRHIHGSAT